jgi:hypothetical protein
VFEAAFIELLLVKTSECRRQTTKRPDQLELRSNDRNDEAESRLMCKLETLLGFTLRFGQRISRCEKICIQVVAAICPEREVAGSIRDIERATYQITTRPNVPRPWHNEIAERHVCFSLITTQSAPFDQLIPEPAELETSLIVLVSGHIF